MSIPRSKKSDTPARVFGDLALVFAGATICAVCAIRFQWSERLFAWTRSTESFQLDELAFVLLALAVGLAWFAARRWRETRRELKARLQVQTKLAQTLDEQRRLGRQFAELQEFERKRLSRELHDELGQFINAIKLDAVAIRTSARGGAGGSTAVDDKARAIMVNADLVHDSVSRLIRELRPVGLDELGLAAAIEHCVDTWRERLAPARLSLMLDERVDGMDEAGTLVVYRTVQEALTNCARHAQASRVDVRVEWRGDGTSPPSAVVQIDDDGIGSDLTLRPLGLGLIGMRERVTALGGSLTLESAAQCGFHLVAQIPAEAARAT